jgi:hypothetical protein
MSFNIMLKVFAIPAKAEIRGHGAVRNAWGWCSWLPAFAGMTVNMEFRR